jgi:hypothetical protein
MSKYEITSPSTTVDALNRTLDAPALDPVLLAIANLYLEGRSIEDIAEQFSISTDRVTTTLDKREVKAYIDGVFATHGYLNRIKRMKIINAVIDQKMADALETGIYTKKDLLDWMKHLHELETATKPKETGPRVAVQINNYDKLMKDLFDD